MCGITGVYGVPQAASIVRKGLERLEYRGYDSAGVAWLDDAGIEVAKAVGRVSQIPPIAAHGETVAIGHTRWATHGGVTHHNAHPHLDATGRYAVVHNGTIEGHIQLRGGLQKDGHAFRGETDTEVLAHLYERARRHLPPLEALRDVTAGLQGSWALGILDNDEKALLFARNKTPLILGLLDPKALGGTGKGGAIIASDVTAMLEHTRSVVYLDDGDHGIINENGVQLFDEQGRVKALSITHIEWDLKQAEKSGYPHFMLKEIHEAPMAINQCLAGRIRLDPVHVESGIFPGFLAGVKRIRLVACGTSYHAALMGRHYLENWARIPCEVTIASELRERPLLHEDGLLYIGVSQSGETLDTMEALRFVKKEGYPILAVSNVQGSSITRLADHTMLTRVGPEVGVAATKTLLGQVASLAVLALEIAQTRETLDGATIERLAHDLARLPRVLEETLGREEELAALGQVLARSQDLFFLGRGVHVATAYEAALKFKEITYRHAEGFGSAELKHGPFALLSAETPCVFFVPAGDGRAKVISNMIEVAARGAPVYALVQGETVDLEGIVDGMTRVPGGDVVGPAALSLAGQMLAYHAAVRLECSIDMPRNLAKSVTVE